MTRTRNLIRSTALLTLGAMALAASDASASSFDAFRDRQHRLHHGAYSVRLAGPGRPSCLSKQVRPDGTVVFIDRCAAESALSTPAIARAVKL